MTSSRVMTKFAREATEKEIGRKVRLMTIWTFCFNFKYLQDLVEVEEGRQCVSLIYT